MSRKGEINRHLPGHMIYVLLPLVVFMGALSVARPDLMLDKMKRLQPRAWPVSAAISYLIFGGMLYHCGIMFLRQLREDRWRSHHASRRYVVATNLQQRFQLGPILADGPGRIILNARVGHLRDDEAVEMLIKTKNANGRDAREVTLTICPALSGEGFSSHYIYVSEDAWPVWLDLETTGGLDRSVEITLLLDVKCRNALPSLPVGITIPPSYSEV